MPLNRNPDHVAQAIARFVEQFKDKPNLEALVSALVSRTQDMEDVSWEAYISLWFDNAVGSRLDDIGVIVKQPREGRDDNTYRKWLQARILLNRTHARPDDTLDVLALILADTSERSLVEEYPAAYVVRIYNDTSDPDMLLDLLRLAKPAGVSLRVEYSSEASDGLFSFSSELGTIETSTDTGYSDVSETTGGRYAGVVR